jgi:hypothetical protein
MAAGYVFSTVGSLALVAATTKTILNLITAANALTRIVEFSVSFDGVTASAIPALVELCYSTQAGAGTPGSAPTISQLRGPTRTVQATAAQNYGAEPTVLTSWKRWFVPVYNGLLVIQFPLGREPEQIVTADALAIRVTAPAIVNVSGYIEFEEG